MDLQQEDAPDVRLERRWTTVVVLAFAAVALLAIADIVADFGEGTTVGHVVIEVGIVGLGGVGLALGVRRVAVMRRSERASRERLAAANARLAAVRQEVERWRSEAKDLLHGLGAAIDRQLVRWDLTPAEQDIARLLLKGLSHKQVAELRQVSEATVRQQSRGVYRKAGVEGRHDLAAFFLEGILQA